MVSDYLIVWVFGIGIVNVYWIVWLFGIVCVFAIHYGFKILKDFEIFLRKGMANY